MQKSEIFLCYTSVKYKNVNVKIPNENIEKIKDLIFKNAKVTYLYGFEEINPTIGKVLEKKNRKVCIKDPSFLVDHEYRSLWLIPHTKRGNILSILPINEQLIEQISSLILDPTVMVNVGAGFNKSTVQFTKRHLQKSKDEFAIIITRDMWLNTIVLMGIDDVIFRITETMLQNCIRSEDYMNRLEITMEMVEKPS